MEAPAPAPDSEDTLTMPSLTKDEDIDDDLMDDELFDDELDELESLGGGPGGATQAEDDEAMAHRQRHAITGRGVTLAMLMADGVIQPGVDVMSIDYLGQKFIADLLADGRIKVREGGGSGQIFSSPSAWAIHCKRIVNPMKKSGCGWASVRYKGKKLDVYKSSWFKKHRPSLPSNASLNEAEDEIEEGERESKIVKLSANESTGDDGRGSSKPPDLTPSFTGKVVRPPRDKRLSVKHSSLGRRIIGHQTVLVECASLTAMNKMQPFNLCLSTNCLLLMDFHCHLKTSEVVGYLAGKWDSTTQQLNVTSAFPCLCPSADADQCSVVEDSIRRLIEERGLVVAGWYHSHALCQADPSLRDIEAQMEYQYQLKGSPNTFQPCFGCVISPFYSRVQGQISEMQTFYVLPPSEQRPLDYGMPVTLQHNLCMENHVGDDMYSEMVRLVKYYKGDLDFVTFDDYWDRNTTYRKLFQEILAKNCPNAVVDKRLQEIILSL